LLAAADGGDRLARQAASALYHVVSAISMAWEGARGGSAQRTVWAQLVLLHRVLPRDPLTASEVPREWTADSPLALSA
jgi:acyl-CoA dehydrogenase